MKHYWAHQTKRWLNEDEQRGFHLDYDPQDTKEKALYECMKFLARGIVDYTDAVVWRAKELLELPTL